MSYRAARVIPVLAVALAAGLATGGCSAGATAVTAAGAAGSPSATASGRFDGPDAPDLACADALKAEKTLEAKQGKDQGNETALDNDFMDFADALNAAARRARDPATAKAMTVLADDYTALVESQSGAAQLPDMATVTKDGATFDKACPAA
jgi:hypothetical protein